MESKDKHPLPVTPLTPAIKVTVKRSNGAYFVHDLLEFDGGLLTHHFPKKKAKHQTSTSEPQFFFDGDEKC